VKFLKPSDVNAEQDPAEALSKVSYNVGKRSASGKSNPAPRGAKSPSDTTAEL